ncbi:MAG: hypothetical protein IKU33_08080, partial [Bacteroidales bacterium]|nr:hypothetical protein [Bacteroidales bacterium]
NGESVYGETNSAHEGEIAFEAPEAPLSHLWLVVMGAPTEHKMNPFSFNQEEGGEIFDDQWPYAIRF